MEKKIVIAGTSDEIWAVNPVNKKRVRIQPKKTKVIEILDIQPTERSIYDAYETWTYIYSGLMDIQRVNLVKVRNSLNSKEAFTIYPPEPFLTNEKRYAPQSTIGPEIEFKFIPEGNKLGYAINHIHGTIFPETKGIPETEDDELGVDGNSIIYMGKEIAEFDRTPRHLHILNSSLFFPMLKRNHKGLYRIALSIK